jgi:hypothetical protein
VAQLYPQVLGKLIILDQFIGHVFLYFMLLELYSKCSIIKAKAVPLYATKALGGNGSIAPTHSRPQH